MHNQNLLREAWPIIIHTTQHGSDRNTCFIKTNVVNIRQVSRLGEKSILLFPPSIMQQKPTTQGPDGRKWLYATRFVQKREIVECLCSLTENKGNTWTCKLPIKAVSQQRGQSDRV